MKTTKKLLEASEELIKLHVIIKNKVLHSKPMEYPIELMMQLELVKKYYSDVKKKLKAKQERKAQNDIKKDFHPVCKLLINEHYEALKKENEQLTLKVGKLQTELNYLDPNKDTLKEINNELYEVKKENKQLKEWFISETGQTITFFKNSIYNQAIDDVIKLGNTPIDLKDRFKVSIFTEILKLKKA